MNLHQCTLLITYTELDKKAMTSNFIADDKFDSTKYLFEKTMEQILKMPS